MEVVSLSLAMVVVTGEVVVEVAPEPSVTEEDGVFVVLTGLLPVVVLVSSETPVVV